MHKKELSTREAQYLLALVKEHADFYRALAVRPSCSLKHKAVLELVETLVTKLSRASL
jgi:hypothetical protein